MATDVWLPLTTLVLGYAGSLVTEAIRDRRATDRETRAREATSAAERRALRDNFQRATLLDLQQALADYGRGIGATHHQDEMAYRKTGKWGKNLYTEEWSNKLVDAQIRTLMLNARVQDKTLRDMIEQFNAASTQLTFAKTERQAQLRFQSAIDLHLAAVGRVGELIRELH